MQSSASMRSVSYAEKLFGRIEERGKKLRLGQKAAIEFVCSHPSQNIYNGVLPTGYGKSVTALAICDVLKHQGRANRFLFIVPTDTQRMQYVTGVASSVAAYGFDIRLVEQNIDRQSILAPVLVDGSARVHRFNRENRCELFVTTVQHLINNEGFYADLMSSGLWMVFCDEYQKLNMDEGARWGKSVAELRRNVLLGLTATPVRSDRKATVFADKEPDFSVSLEEAYREEAIRGVVAHVEHYYIDIEKDDGSIERLTTENVNDYEISKELRFKHKYIASIIIDAYSCLCEKNKKYERQHQMLVFAMGVAHAREVSKALNELFGPSFSKWIGVGPSGQSAEENAAIIKDYKDNKFKCLVQVDIAGEGFDNPRSSVLVFLNLLKKSTVKAVQQMGRGLRRNYYIVDFADDICDIFVSPDIELAELAKELSDRTFNSHDLGEDQEPGDGEPKKRRVPLYSIPSFDPKISDVEYQRSEIYKKVADRQINDIRAFGVQTGQLPSDISDDRIKAVIVQYLMEKSDTAEPMKSFEERVKDAQRILVHNAIRLRYGDSVPKTAAGDMYKTINSRWNRESGMKHDGMIEEDFRMKHQWLENINKNMQSTREVPSWLQL